MIKLHQEYIFYSTLISVNRDELQVYDGINPVKTFDIFSGGNGSKPGQFIALNNKIYFKATSNIYGTELFVIDTGATGVDVAADIEPGDASSGVIGICKLNNKLYFAAATTNYGYELYSYDGTTATRLTDINPGAGNGLAGYPMVYKNQIYFSGAATGNNTNDHL